MDVASIIGIILVGSKLIFGYGYQIESVNVVADGNRAEISALKARHEEDYKRSAEQIEDLRKEIKDDIRTATSRIEGQIQSAGQKLDRLIERSIPNP